MGRPCRNAANLCVLSRRGRRIVLHSHQAGLSVKQISVRGAAKVSFPTLVSKYARRCTQNIAISARSASGPKLPLAPDAANGSFEPIVSIEADG